MVLEQFFDYSSQLPRFFDTITHNYLVKRQAQEEFKIIFRHKESGQYSVAPGILRFTEKYSKRLYYRLIPLTKLKATSFITLTMPNEAYDEGSYDSMMADHRKIWTKVRAWFAKYLPPGSFQFFRTYEFTKKNGLHLHFVIYNEIDLSILQKFAHYYHNKFGFIKLKRFAYDEDMVTTFTYWIDEEKSYWYIDSVNNLKEDRQYLVTNYVMKYLYKEPNDTHKALFTRYKLRTFSISQNLRDRLNKIESTGEWERVHMTYSDKPLLEYAKLLTRHIEGELVHKKTLEQPRISTKELVRNRRIRWRFLNRRFKTGINTGDELVHNPLLARFN